MRRNIVHARLTRKSIAAAVALAVLAIAVPVASADSGSGNGKITIVTTEFVAANSVTGDVIFIARGGPFGSATPGHGTENYDTVQPTSRPNEWLYVGHDVYHTSFGTIRLNWRTDCHPVNSAQTKWYCGNGTWHITSATGAYQGYRGSGTFTNLSYSDSTGASFAHSYEKGHLHQQQS